MKKRCLSMLLALCMMLSLLPASVFAVEMGEAVASIGETPFSTLEDALVAEPAGAIILLQDVATEAVELTEGYTLHAEDASLAVSNSFTMEQYEQFAGEVTLAAGATLTIAEDTFTATEETVLEMEEASLSIQKGVLTLTSESVTLPNNMTWTVGKDATLDIATTLYVWGTLVNRGVVAGNGTLAIADKLDVTGCFTGKAWDSSLRKISVTTDGSGNYLSQGVQVGDAVYDTLEIAVAKAIEAKETTVTLLNSLYGNGVRVPEGTELTIDLNGHTFTMAGNMVGSTGTQTQAFQFLKNSQITIKNGTIQMGNPALKMLIQNYANLTLEDVCLDGTMTDGSACNYVLSNNCGKVQLLGNTSIYAANGKYAMDVCATTHYPAGAQVLVNTTGTLEGNIEYGVWTAIPETNLCSLTMENGIFTGAFVMDEALQETAKEHIFVTGGQFTADNKDTFATFISSDSKVLALKSNPEGYYTIGDYYTVKWVVNGETVLTDDKAVYGQTPVYEKEAELKNFVSWTPAVKPVEGDATYTARFSQSNGLGAGFGGVQEDTSDFIFEFESDENALDATTEQATWDSLENLDSVAFQMATKNQSMTVTFNSEAVGQIAGADKDTHLTLTELSLDNLNAAQKDSSAKNAKLLFDISLTDGSNDVLFQNGTATVTFPYTMEDATKKPVVYCYTDAGNCVDMEATYADGMLTFTTNHFTTFGVEENNTFVETKMWLGFVDGDGNATTSHYNQGESFTVNLYASSSVEGILGGVQTYLEYDHNVLELAEITRPTVYKAGDTFIGKIAAGRISYTTPVSHGVTVGTEPVVVATITFNIHSGTDTQDTLLSLSNMELTLRGNNDNQTPVASPLTANIHNIKVTLDAGENALFDNAKSDRVITVYAKYNKAGLYRNENYQPLSMPDLVANTNYRLADGAGEFLWTDGTELFIDTQDIRNEKLTEDTTYTVRTVAVRTITFITPTHGSYTSSADKLSLDKGTLLGTVTLPSYEADTGYEFAGWQDNNNETVVIETYALNKNITMEPIFTPKHFTITIPETTGVTIEATDGVNDPDPDTTAPLTGEVIYGEEVTFTVTPTEEADNRYSVLEVSYTVDDGEPVVITPNEDGSYTIPGDKLLGEISVQVTTQKYHEVVFSQTATGCSVTPVTETTTITLYTKDGEAGLYTDKKCLPASQVTDIATILTTTAKEGYRLKDKEGESLWQDEDSNGYTNASLFTSIFTGDTTLTLQAQKTYVISYEAGDNGSLSGETSYILDEGSSIGTNIPTPVADTGYRFQNEWKKGSKNSNVANDSMANESVTQADTYTALFTYGKYKLTLADTNSNIEKYDVDDTTVEDLVGDGTESVTATITYQKDVTFTITPEHNKVLTEIIVTIDGEDKTYTIDDVANDPEGITVVKNEDGTFTVTLDGDLLIGDTTVTVVSVDGYTLTFETADSTKGSVGGKTSFLMKKNEAFTGDLLDQVTTSNEPGYTFNNWMNKDTSASASEANICVKHETDATYQAVFVDASYEVTGLTSGTTSYYDIGDGKSSGLDKINGQLSATHGTDVTFFPVQPNKIVTNVTCTVGGNTVELTQNEDGSYTLAGNEIIGAVDFQMETLDASFEFITQEQYMALPHGYKIAVLNTAKLADGNGYVLGNTGIDFLENGGNAMYWSERYQAYVRIVAESENAYTLSPKLHSEAMTVKNVKYTGDLNNDGEVTTADAAIIQSILDGTRVEATTEMQYLGCDVSNTVTITDEVAYTYTEHATEGYKTVTVSDVMWVLLKWVNAE